MATRKARVKEFFSIKILKSCLKVTNDQYPLFGDEGLFLLRTVDCRLWTCPPKLCEGGLSAGPCGRSVPAEARRRRVARLRIADLGLPI
jgi:hypothetical protein